MTTPFISAICTDGALDVPIHDISRIPIFSEREFDKHELVPFPDISKRTLTLILDYLHGAFDAPSLAIGEVFDTLNAANMLCLTKLVDVLSRHIARLIEKCSSPEEIRTLFAINSVE